MIPADRVIPIFALPLFIVSRRSASGRDVNSSTLKVFVSFNETLRFGKEDLVPLRAGETVPWKVA